MKHLKKFTTYSIVVISMLATSGCTLMSQSSHVDDTIDQTPSSSDQLPEVVSTPFEHTDVPLQAMTPPTIFDHTNTTTFFVAHALGSTIDDPIKSMGSNSLEAFLNSYMRGFKLFEMDFMLTKDDVLVGLHDGAEDRIGLSTNIKDVTYKEFNVQKFRDTFTLLSFADILSILKKFPDAYIVTDIKSDFKKSLESIERIPQVDTIKDRIIIQVYAPQQTLVAKEYGYRHIIFTLYRSNLSNEEVIHALRTYPEIGAVTMPWEMRYTDDFLADIVAEGRMVFVHTVNDPHIIHSFIEKGVGVYTDIFDVGAYMRENT